MLLLLVVVVGRQIGRGCRSRSRCIVVSKRRFICWKLDAGQLALLQPVLVEREAGLGPASRRQSANLADVLVGNGILVVAIVDADTIAMLPTQANITLNHETVLLDTFARAVDKFFAGQMLRACHRGVHLAWRIARRGLHGCKRRRRAAPRTQAVGCVGRVRRCCGRPNRQRQELVPVIFRQGGVLDLAHPHHR